MCSWVPSHHKVASQYLLGVLHHLLDLGSLEGGVVHRIATLKRVSPYLYENFTLLENTICVNTSDESSRVRYDNPSLFLDSLVGCKLHPMDNRVEQWLFKTVLLKFQ
jgi:hypothetical protein